MYNPKIKEYAEKHNLAVVDLYRWGNDINGAIAGATTNVFTIEQFYTGIRCFIKDANGNWHASQRVNIGQFSSQREGSETGIVEKVLSLILNGKSAQIRRSGT